MSHELYIFGSICRGEISPTSDVDVLVVPFVDDRSCFPSNWSIYTPELLREYYSQGRLFAWHLHLEARNIFTSNDRPYLSVLGEPAPYSTMRRDINDLEELLQESVNELRNGTKSEVYELGIAYTAIRDIAMSASWAMLGVPCFSSDAPYRLPNPPPLQIGTYRQAMLARHSSTRGAEIPVELEMAVKEIVNAPFGRWINSLRA
jgi:predicted nucleotidyltransferase